jgi:hypothetical protein
VKRRFKVENFQTVNGTGLVKAGLDVTLASGLWINNLLILQKDNGAKWIRRKLRTRMATSNGSDTCPSMTQEFFVLSLRVF